MFSVKLPIEMMLIISFLTLMSCFSGHTYPPPRYEKPFPDLRRQIADSSSNKYFLKRDLSSIRKQIADASSNRYFLKRDLSAIANKTTQIPNITYTNSEKFKKIGVVSKKHYEIINFLWRKTKIFVNVPNTTPKHKKDNITGTVDFLQGKNPIVFSSHSLLNPQSSTPSYIEFYYSDETDGQAQKDCMNGNCLESNGYKLNTFKSSPNSSFIVFHIKGPLSTRKSTKKTYSIIGLPSQPLRKLPAIDKLNINKRAFTAVNATLKINRAHKISTNAASNEASKTKPTHNLYRKTTPISKSNEQYIEITNRHEEFTTIYDKIKFFEIYDSNTRVPYFEKEDTFNFDNYDEADDKIKFLNVSKVLLEDVDQNSHEHNESKHSKKHVLENVSISNESCVDTVNGINFNDSILNITSERYNKTNSYSTNYRVVPNKITTEYRKSYTYYANKSVSWSEYPFAAVYTYEPLNLYCDAASISAHWLVASGACLSRMNKESLTGGRSAFVAYCGENWWQPERIAYVKYSVVHPSYHPTEQARSYLYNIGVIQVVTSMTSACSDWVPVSIMSHQYTASQRGSEALALGWGLDRFHTRDVSSLPKSLAMYRGLMYSDLCPGNIAYSKAKRAGEEGLRNVHCLSLPPYSGEDRDPVHGSLLLVGGKLIALYLQEERRLWGEQSALYTGVWRLIPWVMKVAKEPETEAFTVDI